MSELEDRAPAIENLADRESCEAARIGFEQKGPAATGPIADWLKPNPDVDAVVWTDLPSNWKRKRGKDFSCEDALRYVRELGRQKRDRAEQYVRNAPRQIQTNLRDLLRKELRWSDKELAKALFI